MRNPFPQLFTRLSPWAAMRAFLFAELFLISSPALARVGGGGSYSGGHSGGGGGDGGGLIYLAFRLLFWLTIEYPAIGIPVDIIVIAMVVRHFRSSSGSGDGKPVLQLATVSAARPASALRRFDPNFSEITLTDFCYSLYARAHHARGEGKLDQYSPYISAEARAALIARNPANLREVRDVIIGSSTIEGVQGLDTPLVRIPVTYESNLTEVTGQGEQSWYLRENWILERKRDTLSPTPQKAKADHCPRCGAALRTRTDGSCDYCGAKIVDGTFQWFVRFAGLISREARGPLLTSDVPEEGTSSPTVSQPHITEQQAAFEAAHPEFHWQTFEQFVRKTAETLQSAWTSREWESVRPLETESLFQMHRYWIDAYVKQGLRNVVDEYAVTRVKPVKIDSDAFYESVTVRLFAQGKDHTDDKEGKVVTGSKSSLREWSEYWTFIRTLAAAKTGPSSCPNCGAPVDVGATGICSHCGGKLTAGDYDWILSRIEQDEAYKG